jgi:hypothetical protein
MLIALVLLDEKSPVTALVTDAMIPPSFDRASDPLPDDLALPFEEVFLAVARPLPADFDTPLDCFAPPDAVRLPAAPLFVPVEVLEPPDLEAAADLAVPPFDPADFVVPAVLEAPVLLIPELLDEELLFEPPVFAVPDLEPPWLDDEDDFAAGPDLDPPLFEPEPSVDLDLVFDELFAVAIL